MPSAQPENLNDLLATMKRAAAALRDADVDFMLGGGLAIWALGGPPTDHDVDFFVREEDAERGLQALVDIGMRAERPPEDWLLKAYDGGTLVDLIFRPAGGHVTNEHFQRATELEVSAQRVLVASIDDVLAAKLLALSEQEPDFRDVLAVARALREQIDWDRVEVRSHASPFARAFFTLVEELGIIEPRSRSTSAQPNRANDRPEGGAPGAPEGRRVGEEAPTSGRPRSGPPSHGRVASSRPVSAPASSGSPPS